MNTKEFSGILHYRYVIEATNQEEPEVQGAIDAYMRKWPPQGYGTSVVHKEKKDGKIKVVIDREGSCD